PLKELDQPLPPCDVCSEAKLRHAPKPPVATRRATAVGELVHTDIIGPWPTRSWGGAWYVVVFVDSYSRFGAAYPVRAKSQAAAQFVKFATKLRAEAGAEVLRVRSDGGGEYTGAEFQAALQAGLVYHERTVPYSSHQNGVAERYNQTLQTT